MTGRFEAEFLGSAADPAQFPRERAGEVAFLGRSNVGKSSLINRLVSRTDLAYTSSRPGCTRTINFYRLGAGLRLVDLPGYGYAAGPIEDKIAWGKLIEGYLAGREDLRLALVLLDARRGWMDPDRQMRDWLAEYGRPYLVAITKIDKLNQKEYHRSLEAIRKEIPGMEPVPCSAVDGRGVRELWQTISKIKTSR